MKLTPYSHFREQVLSCLLALGLALACTEDSARAPPTADSVGIEFGVVDPCRSPNTGCPCESEGEALDCGRVHERQGDYLTCSMGTRTCHDGAWGTCVGERVTVREMSPQGGTRLQGLGAAAVCDEAFDELCDPYCNVTPDTAGGFDLGPAFSNTPGGLTLTATVSAVACTTLTLTPSVTTVTVKAFGPPPTTTPSGPVTFTLTAGPAGCDVTLPFATTWVVNRVDRATITGSNNTNGSLALSVPVAGVVRVTAYALGLTPAYSDITYKVNVVEAPTSGGTPNATASGTSPYTAINAFSTVAGACAPTVTDNCRNSPNVPATASTATWLYPYANTYFPLALPAPWLQYLYSTTGGGGGAVKVSLRYPVNLTATAAGTLFNYSLIVKEQNGVSAGAVPTYGGKASNILDPQVVIPQAAWQYFEDTARGADADLIIQRRQGGGTLETELRRPIHFVDGQLKGMVYYNSYTSALGGNTGAVLRISPGATSPTLAVQPTSSPGSTRLCTVCHTVNDTGTRLIVNGQRPSGGVPWNNSRRYNISNPATAANAVPVVNSYDNSIGSDTPDYNIQGDRFTFGAPFKDGSVYMTHGGEPNNDGDRNWRAPNDYSRLYKLLDTPVGTGTTSGGGANTTLLSVTNWNNISAVTPRFSPDGTRLAFGYWGAGTNLRCFPTNSATIAASGCTTSGSPRTIAPLPAGNRLVVADITCSSPPCTAASTGWEVKNARSVTPGVSERVAWPAFTTAGTAVVYQRQYRTSMSVDFGGRLNGGWITAPWEGAGVTWSPSHINSIAGALAQIWMSNVPADGSTAATPTRLNQLNGLNSAGTSYLPTASRLVAPAQNVYHAANASFGITMSDYCAITGTATGVNDNQLNYMPSIAPTEPGGLVWVIFTSRRMFGNVAYDDPWDAQPGLPCNSGVPLSKKFWVAAVDKTWTPGTDPSHPAFYLPGQELAAGNSDADWVSSACLNVGGNCTSNDDCCSGSGSAPLNECRIISAAPLTRQCQPVGDCSLTGEGCAVTTDCCSGVCPAAGGVCLVPSVTAPTFAPQTFTREYEATCPYASHPVWRAFEWQATVPAGTSLDFSVQTKQNASDAYAPVAPRPLITATSVNTLSPSTWYRGPSTVGATLAATTPPLTSGRYLLVTTRFNPLPTSAPTLHKWRQIFDCVPAE